MKNDVENDENEHISISAKINILIIPNSINISIFTFCVLTDNRCDNSS